MRYRCAPHPRRPALRAVTTAGASRRYKMRRLCFCSVLLMSPVLSIVYFYCYGLFQFISLFLVFGSFDCYVIFSWFEVWFQVRAGFDIYFLMCLACFIEFVVSVVDVVGVSISI